jgi:hypothetical protein
MVNPSMAEALGRGQRVAPHLEIGRRQREELGDVAAGAEGLAARPAHDDDAHGLVGLEAGEDPGELVAHGHGHRVHLGLAVDPERGDRPLLFDSEELAHLLGPPWGWPPGAML